jgi:hypothetical protein
LPIGAFIEVAGYVARDYSVKHQSDIVRFTRHNQVSSLICCSLRTLCPRP